MTYRALELLNLPPGEPAFLLDIGCGSGLSGEILDEEGYVWAGVDVAPSMLGACVRPASPPPLRTVLWIYLKAVLTWKTRGCARTRGRR